MDDDDDDNDDNDDHDHDDGDNFWNCLADEWMSRVWECKGQDRV